MVSIYVAMLYAYTTQGCLIMAYSYSHGYVLLSHKNKEPRPWYCSIASVVPSVTVVKMLEPAHFNQKNYYGIHCIGFTILDLYQA